MIKTPSAADWLARLAPGLFVVLWATGFIGAKLGLPHAPPMAFLAIRFALVAVALGLWMRWRGAVLPERRHWRPLVLVGLLMQIGYLGGVFSAINLGTEAGVAALITGLQPALTALLAWYWLGERFRPVQWLGVALGLGGVVLVVLRKLSAGIGAPEGIFFCLLALVSIAFGTVLQKRHCADAPIAGAQFVQVLVAALTAGLLSFLFETRPIDWHPEFIFALGWLVVVLSLGAFLLLSYLIRHGAAAKTASLFFLVPPVTAFVGWLLFDEQLGLVEFGGVALTALGVWLVNRR